MGKLVMQRSKDVQVEWGKQVQVNQDSKIASGMQKIPFPSALDFTNF